MSTRTCTTCKQTFPEDRDHFGQFKNPIKGGFRVGWRNVCRGCMSANSRKHHAANPDNAKARSAARREREREAGPAYSEADITRLQKVLGGCCRYCSVQFDGSEEVDHLTPVARGGTHAVGNLTLACHACNRAKGSKTLPEFIRWRAERKLPIRADVPPGESPSAVTREMIRVD